MQRFEVSGAVRPIYGSLGVKRLNKRGRQEFIFFCVALERVAGSSILKCLEQRMPGNSMGIALRFLFQLAW